jgi:glucokinase
MQIGMATDDWEHAVPQRLGLQSAQLEPWMDLRAEIRPDMPSVLLADIGGTNSRFALAGPDGRPEHIQILENDTRGGIEESIAQYLSDSGARPDAAVLAVAAPVGGGDEVTLTNRSWRFRKSELARHFGFTSLQVVNDFEAIAWALLRLTPADVHPLGRAVARREGVRLALGPGTGLGVAALVPSRGHWHVVSSEGGHASFGAQAPDEIEVFMRLLREHGHVSAETVLSGPGLVRLMRAVDPQSQHQAPETVVAAALAGDAPALTTTRLFVRLLGRFAGGVALTFKAFGGVYLAGGVASRLGHLMDGDAFRAAFEAHPPYQQWLATTPTLMMSRTEPGLLGCAALADQLSGDRSA